jgi:hypothetical protein
MPQGSFSVSDGGTTSSQLDVADFKISERVFTAE